MKISGFGEEKIILKEIAMLMSLSAKTAPKGKGQDTVEIMTLTEKDKDAISDEMRNMADKFGKDWIRDAINVEKAPVLMLFGIKGPGSLGVNCGACGYDTCDKMLNADRNQPLLFSGPTCVIRAVDLGIAIGSAVKTAQIHNADTRVFFRAGVAAYRLKYLPKCTMILAVPLSATSKNIFFDR